jgi:hypothetical protein
MELIQADLRTEGVRLLTMPYFYTLAFALGRAAVRTIITMATFIAPVEINALLYLLTFDLGQVLPPFQTSCSVSHSTQIPPFTFEHDFLFPLTNEFLSVFVFLPDFKSTRVKEAFPKKLCPFAIPRETPVFGLGSVAIMPLPNNSHVPERQDLKIKKVLKRHISGGIVNRLWHARHI